MRHFILLLLAFVSYFSAAHADLPENDLWKEDGMFFSSMTESQFNSAIDEVVLVYKPIVEAHGARLVVNKLWSNSTVNASASQSGNTWYLNFYGGLARRPEITLEGFQLVVAHELGHHLGGVAFYEGEDEWAASEGQSDYFSTQAVAKNIWKNDAFVGELSEYAKKLCDDQYYSRNDKSVCYRSLAAGQSLANLLATISGQPKPSFETPSQKVVSSTYTAHPAAQIRLDTYVAGALCKQKFEDSIIPGRHHQKGQESAEAEMEAYKYSCKEGVGARPRSWFAPKAN